MARTTIYRRYRDRRDLLRAALQPVEDQISDDVAQGRLASHVDADVVVSLLLGAYLAEVVRRGRVRPDWLRRSADLLAVTLAPHA